MSSSPQSLPSLSATEIAAGVADGSFSAEHVVQAHLDRIEEVNPAINAVVTLDSYAALEAARGIDWRRQRGGELGPLAGVPVGIKDTTDTEFLKTTYGCKLFEDHIPQADAAVVSQLKAADAIIIGKTNTPEFATGANTFNEIFGITRNPWNPKLSAGGSSGGGASGLAAHLFPLAEGTDLGGSLRVPAAFCGIVGMRPTPGIVPYLPNPAPYDRFDVEGPMARTVDDLALALSVMSGHQPNYPNSIAPSTPLGIDSFRDKLGTNFRVAFVADVASVGVDQEILLACSKASLALADNGHDIIETDLDLSPGREAFTTLRAQWMLNRHFALLEDRAKLGENLRTNIEKGLSQTPLEIAGAEAVRTECWRRLCDCFAYADLIVTPTTPVLPFPAEENYPTQINGQPMASYIDWIAPTFVFSLLGVPAATVPIGISRDGLPIGLQIVGRRYEDMSVLALANDIQQTFPIPKPKGVPALQIQKGD